MTPDPPMTREAGGPLWRTIALRMALAALAVSLGLAGFYFLHYTLDTPWLRRTTLEARVADIVAALTAGRDPASWPGYRRYPDSYGFRVFDHRAGAHRNLVSSANAALLPSTDESDIQAHELQEGFASLSRPGDAAGEDRWLLTDRDQVGDKAYWIEAVMVGDPAGGWRDVMVQEMLDHVAVPMLSVVPLLTLAMFLAVRHALRPLGDIAGQARRLGGAAASGRALAPLARAGLARELREVVDALNAMLARLDHSLQTQRQFTADAAHELRTPLAVLQLEAAQLAPQPGKQRVLSEIADLAALLDRLLRFAQTEDAMAEECLPVDLAAAARRVCEELAPVAAARGLELAFDVAGSTAALAGHAALIDSAVRNVVENAVKFSPAGSVITVSVQDGARVVVDDQGPGVAAAQRTHVFERFWRAAASEGGGSGIGLALARRIARLHGGDVTLTDAPGGGARFALSFAPPAARAEEWRQSRISVRS